MKWGGREGVYLGTRRSTLKGSRRRIRLAILKASDLSEEIQGKIFELTDQAIQNYKVEKDVAAYLKKELDQIYGPTWHVIVGKSFGSYVTHEQGYFIYFYIGELAFLIFKSG